MKRSSLIALLVLVALVGVSIAVYIHKSRSGTIDEDASNFKVKDTASIDKIFMADKNGKSVTLTREKGTWMVDGKFEARSDIMRELLATIFSVEVKSPVAKSARKNVIKRMAAQGIKVEIYSQGDKIRQYYVGSSTQDYTGTYMLLSDPESGENFEEPFVTYIPGFEGFLTNRYLTDAAEWRNRLVINFIPPQMKSIRLDLHETPDSSFTIDLSNNAMSYSLKSGKGQPLNFDPMRMKQYLAYFQNIHCEKLLTGIKDHVTDSLQHALPFATMTITETAGKTHVYNFLHRQPNAGKNQQYGVDYKYDPDRLFLKFDNDKELAIIQYYVFGKLLQTWGYFMPPPVKK
ncbi:MAG: hypothetical protein JST26_18130 [Bacteroidetes bacterium]|nr:hypothetical protein [Bacteroidota bacterium]